jgi:hypothetical protein
MPEISKEQFNQIQSIKAAAVNQITSITPADIEALIESIIAIIVMLIPPAPSPAPTPAAKA